MKKISLLILTSFVSALLFNISTAFAVPDDPKQLKVYYSEPIGAGDKVYKVTACRKAPSYAPLKCIAKFDSDGRILDEVGWIDDSQCMKEGKALDGEYVQGCLVPNAYEEVGEKENSSGAGLARYPKVDKTRFTQKKADGGCSDEAEQHGFEYVQEWAIVDKTPPDISPAPTGDALKKYWTIRGTIASKEKPSPELIEAKFGKSKVNTPLEAETFSRPALCVTYDVFAEDSKFSKDKTKGTKEAQGELIGRVKKLFDDISGESMDDSKCNTDNSKKDVGGIKAATPFDDNPTFSCSIQERIVGSSGSDLLANYIGAIYRWAAGIVGIVAVLIMVASGIQISAAGGDSAKLDSAKNRILQSIIGLAILFLSGLILYTINPTFFTGG